MITNHTQLLNALIEKYGLKSYLEIGVQNPANNFDLIKCEWKLGVDSDPFILGNIIKLKSDDFFKEYHTRLTFDLIFIDGLHHADQVKRDFENSLRCLSDHGFIVIHDVLPENEAGTIVPRETKVWWGDVYKFAMTLDDYDGVAWKTFNIDNGCMLVWKEPDAKSSRGVYGIDYFNWQNYKMYGHHAMNVTNEVTI